MTRRDQRKFTPQCEVAAVRLVRAGGKTVAPLTKQFDLTETTLRARVKRAEADAGMGPPNALTSRDRAAFRSFGNG